MTARKYPTTRNVNEACSCAYNVEFHYDASSGVTTCELVRHFVQVVDGRKVWRMDRVIAEGTCFGFNVAKALHRMRETRWQVRDMSRAFSKAVAS